jgi:putative spermidine/putrescine transport system ATP-binding protein
VQCETPSPPPAPTTRTPTWLSRQGRFVLAFPTVADNFTGIDTASPDIRLSGLTKHYGEVVAVAGIDLEIARGEFFTMLGPSGSGKTTTLRMIAGFEDPTSGTIELAGEDVSDVPPYDRAVNTVFQDYALFPHMSVGENVAYGLKVAGVGKGERARRRDEALEMVRLPGYAERRPGELSGGQRQRVALARAIVNRPEVLLLDEPLGALDLKLREEMQTELKTIQAEVGITFVYVTHDQDEALTMSDRIAVFNKGRIEQVSSPLELYERPANEFVAGFVGVSNLLEREGERITVRPEKIELLEPGAPADGLHTETGRVVDVAYAGAVTRFTVQLDTGEKLQLVRQNVESASADALAGQGNEVLVGWRPEHAAAVGGKSTKEEVAP